MDRKGFTLIELLIVIAIIGILAAAVLVAVDPVGRIQDARNARRWSEANGILNAMLNWQVDNRAFISTMGGSNPVIPATIAGSTGYQMLTSSTPSNGTVTCPKNPGTFGLTGSGPAAWANVATLASTYIAALPIDPNAGAYTAANTGYYIRMSTSGRITIGSCGSEPGVGNSAPTIEVTR